MDLTRYKEKKANGLIKIYKIGDKPVMQTSSFDSTTGALVSEAPYAVDIAQVEAKLEQVRAELEQVEAFHADLLNATPIEGTPSAPPPTPAPTEE